MRRLGTLVDQRGGEQIYLPLIGNQRVNPKIRSGVIDVKSLIEVVDGFERWLPETAAEFPVTRRWINEEFKTALGLPQTSLDRAEYTSEQFVAEVIAPIASVEVVNVTKRRFIYDLGACIGEISDVMMGGIAVATVSVESADLEPLKVMRRKLGLDHFENWSYPQAIHELVQRPPG